MNNKVLLGIGVLLCLVGLLKPNLNSIINKPHNPTNAVVVDKPSDADILTAATKVVDILRNNNASSDDCLRLSGLYYDMAQLISLDGDKQLVRNTEEVRQANRISGLMLRMNINDKYPNLASAMNTVVVTSMGDDNVPLTPELRKKATDAFSALSWACTQGAK